MKELYPQVTKNNFNIRLLSQGFHIINSLQNNTILPFKYYNLIITIRLLPVHFDRPNYSIYCIKNNFLKGSK